MGRPLRNATSVTRDHPLSRCGACGWQVELSKSETSQFRSDLVFDRKLCACNLLTWGLNVVLRYLKSSDFCVAEILWASNVPESSRCWQYHLVDSHFARHAMWFICIDILKIVNCECWNTQQYITFKWDQILSWIYEVISYTRSGTYFREKCSLKWWYHSCWMLKKSETLHK